MFRAAVLATVLTCDVLLTAGVAREGVPDTGAKMLPESLIVSAKPDFPDIVVRNKAEANTAVAERRAQRILSILAVDRAVDSNPKFKDITANERDELYRQAFQRVDGAPVVPLTGEWRDTVRKEAVEKGRSALVGVAALAPALTAGSMFGLPGFVVGGFAAIPAGKIADAVLPSNDTLFDATTYIARDLEDAGRFKPRPLTTNEVFLINTGFDAFDGKPYAGVLTELNEGPFEMPARLNPKVFKIRTDEDRLNRKTEFKKMRAEASARGETLELIRAMEISNHRDTQHIAEVLNEQVVPALRAARADIKVAADYARGGDETSRTGADAGSVDRSHRVARGARRARGRL